MKRANFYRYLRGGPESGGPMDYRFCVNGEELKCGRWREVKYAAAMYATDLVATNPEIVGHVMEMQEALSKETEYSVTWHTRSGAIRIVIAKGE